MTPAYPAKDQLDRLRHHMPDLSMDNDPPGHDDARAAYLHAYGLNFAEHQDRVLYRGGRLSSSQTHHLLPAVATKRGNRERHRRPGARPLRS